MMAPSDPNQPRALRVLPLLLLLLLAAVLRLWQLDVLPPGLFYDEAFNGVDARRVALEGARPLFFPENNGREPLFLYLHALAIWLLGPPPSRCDWLRLWWASQPCHWCTGPRARCFRPQASWRHTYSAEGEPLPDNQIIL